MFVKIVQVPSIVIVLSALVAPPSSSAQSIRDPNGAKGGKGACDHLLLTPDNFHFGDVEVGKPASGIVRVENLYAVNADGTRRWSFRTEGAVDSSPAIGADGTVFVGSNDRNLYAVNEDGSERWRFNAHSAVKSSPSIGGNASIYVGSMNRKLNAVH